jgi:hypothetical protein
MPDYKLKEGIATDTIIDFKNDYRTSDHYKDSYEKNDG